MADRPQMLVTEFEELAKHSGETVSLEFLYGKLGVKAVPDGDHDQTFRWIMLQILRQRPDLWLFPERGLKVQGYRDGRARTDGVLAPGESFVGEGEWADPEPALMVLEITSYDSDTDRRDRVEKPRAYAEAGIPCYLLVDRDSGVVVVFSDPKNGVYATNARKPFGQVIELGDPVNVTLETERFKEWVR
ncbi:Uma2 family endonuclease [Nocardia sp. NPDC051832]|uniref:Uma2 family endonuclease n=1 Tax=Nocardia sp. NPDC051832 TaxID=3155673 RepID=UPI00341B18BE